ncbi:MAG: DUF5721 family protein [Clostridiales bacterium]|nr:DUF5721 family protein [Clostridiales bacterium]
MLTFEMTEETIKSVMHALLKGDTFDAFYVRGMEIRLFTQFEISGVLNQSCYSEEEWEKLGRVYCLWSELKRYAFDMLKGSQKPQLLKIIFSLPDEAARAIHENAAALFLNLAFTENKLCFIAAASPKNFSLDKSVDLLWEEYIRRFFQTNGWSANMLA